MIHLGWAGLIEKRLAEFDNILLSSQNQLIEDSHHDGN
jgi:hypothetical protein